MARRVFFEALDLAPLHRAFAYLYFGNALPVPPAAVSGGPANLRHAISGLQKRKTRLMGGSQRQFVYLALFL
jgi:hypothetical protein